MRMRYRIFRIQGKLVLLALINFSSLEPIKTYGNTVIPDMLTAI